MLPMEKRNLLRNLKHTLPILLAITCITSSIPLISTGGEFRPLVAYKAQVIPKIDGKVSQGEWSDTVTYSYTLKKSSITDKPIQLQCALKHDANWLYILFKVGIENIDHSEEIVTILTTPKDNFTLEASDAIAVFPNGTVKKCSLGVTGFFINWASSLNAEANGTYSNNEHVFEIKIDKRYLHTYYEYAPFNIEYTTEKGVPRALLYGPHTVAIGDSRHTRPGVILLRYILHSSSHPSQNDQYSGWYVLFLILIIAFIAISLFFLRRKKYGLKDNERKPERDEKMRDEKMMKY